MNKQDLRAQGTATSLKSRKLKWMLIVLALVTVGGALFLRNWPPFGGTISGERLKTTQASPQYHDGEFANTLAHPPLDAGDVWGYFIEQFFGDQTRVPPSAIPISVIAPESLQAEPLTGLRAIWLGHLSVYIELDGVRLMVDPVFSDFASPFSGIGPKRTHPPPIALADFPEIDAVIISHDHYDHLDMRTIQYLSSQGTQFLVPLGVGAHLDEWEIPESQTAELDWWGSTEIAGLTIVCTPAQHYSGRGIFDYKETLWSSWSLIGPRHRVFYSGDSGFSNHFRRIGDRFGPFDLSIMKIGQYGPGASWIYSHMELLSNVVFARLNQAAI
jgi:L-ascorbate metabolism protein UlaG (beta-lactamase superfamily)